MPKIWILGPCALLLAGAPAPLAAQTVALPAAADTYLKSGSPNQAQGSGTFLRVQSSGNNRALVRFDGSAIAAAVGSGSLAAASLELFIEDNPDNWGTDGRTVDAHRLLVPWTEAGATWNCPADANPANSSPDCPAQWAGGSFEEEPTDTVLHANGLAGWVRFDVTADVRAYLGGTPNHGWLVKKTEEGQNGRVDYTSREGTATQAPRLELVVESAAFDEVPPSLAVTAPARSVVVNDPTPEIAVAYADGGSGVDLGSLVVRVDGGDITAACTVGPAEATCEPPPLGAGPHTITAEIFDLAGNEGEASRAFELLLGPGLASATFTAVADTYLRQGQPNQSQGGEAFLRLRQSGKNRALVRFDGAEIAKVVGQGTLQSAALVMDVVGNGHNWGPAGRTVDAHRATAAWTEAGATWNCADDANPANQQPDCSPLWAGGGFEGAPTATVLHTNDLAGSVEFEVTADVAAFLAGTANHGWLLKKTQEGASGLIDYGSREGDPDAAPLLVVTFELGGGGEPPGDDEDHTPPTLSILTPSEPLVVNDPTPQILLTYVDGGFGADPDSLEVTVDGADLTPACAVDPASALCEPPPLSSGQHLVGAVVRDLVGNEASASLAFELLLDAEPPVVAIATPAAGAVINSPVVAVTGMVSDGDQVVRVVVDGEPASFAAGAFAAQVDLGQGVNRVRAEATDRAGNRGFAEVSVALDVEAPALTVDTPPPGQLTNSAAVRVAGRAHDAFGVAAVTVDSLAATLAGGRFEAEVALVEGDNDLLVRATDVAGNARDFTLEVRRLTVPTLAVTSPPDLSRTTAVAVDVAGTVSDPAAVVVVEGIAATLTGNAFLAADVPLAVGGNFLSAVAISGNGARASAKVTVIRDLLPPRVAIYEPRDGEVVFADSVHVSGLVNDIVLGTVNSTEATVTVNGVAAQVVNRSFLVAAIPLAPGPNLITARAVDPTGNAAETTIEVVRAEAQGATLTRVAGDLQEAPIGAPLADPLVVRLTDGSGQPVAGRVVYFRVLEGNGRLGPGRRQLAVPTDGAGLAQVSFTLGSRAGTGNHKVEATAAGFAGRAVFAAGALPGPAAHLLLDDGDQQEGQVAQVLPDPLVAVVTDAGFNRLAGVPVTFRVLKGGGTFAGGEPEATVESDADGRVAAELQLGPEPGVAAHVAQASLTASPGEPAATFTATGVAAGDPAATAVSGLVLDNMNQPVPGVTLRLLDTPLTAQADGNGYFRLTGVPVGTFLLVADGSTAQRPGLWPDLEFAVTAVAGHDNTLGMPIYLLPIDQGQGVFVGETRGAVLTLAEYPGFALEIVAGSVTFPGGGRSGVVSATVVHGDKVPMVPNFGQQPRFIVTIQPAGATFDPPARLSLPNVDGLLPGQVTELYSFDHDLASFVSIGPGTVSEDGAVLVSNPGVGIIKAGWHCGGDPASSATTHDCPQCHECIGEVCTPVGGSCDDGDECTENDRCEGGACVGDPLQLEGVEATANGESDLVVEPDQAVSFAAALTAPDCESPEYSWDLGDGTTSTASAPSHTYGEPGTYPVSLRVDCGTCGALGDSAQVQAVELEIFEVTTPSDTAQPPADNSFLAPDDQIRLRARVIGAPELNNRISWRTDPVGGHTGPSNPATATATDTLSFVGRSNLPTGGSRTPNPALGYTVTARLAAVTPAIEDTVPPLPPITQDERDRIRQEYRDFRTNLQPARDALAAPVRAAYNGGNYALIINGEMPGLENGLAGALSAILTAADTQLVQPCPCAPNNQQCLDSNPGQCRLQRLSPLINAGTDATTSRPANTSFNRRVIVFRSRPAGDDEYCNLATGATSQATAVGPSICAGPNGRAETTANTVNYAVPGLGISSGYRNPQRNRAVGSLSVNSLHTTGRALDISLIAIAGLTPGTNAQCVLELAGDRSAGAANAFIETGPNQVPCDNGGADHIHIQRP